MSNVVIDILRSMHGPDTVSSKQNRKRLNVETGKSFTADDIATLAETSISHSCSRTSIKNYQPSDLELDLQSPTTCNTSSSDYDTSIAPNFNGSESDPKIPNQL